MKKIITFSVTIFFSAVVFAQVRVLNPLTENLRNPVGIDIPQPQFSWQLSSPKRNTTQLAYEIRVATTAKKLTVTGELVWSTGKIISPQSLYISYKGPLLQSAVKYYWQVRIWDNENKLSTWSEIATWQMGLLDSLAWKAKWISAPDEDGQTASPLFRTEFNSIKKIESATAYISAHGIYTAFLNGKKIGNALLTPGWSVYEKRLQYQAYDVTHLLKTRNVAGVMLGNGWWYRDDNSVRVRSNKNPLAFLFQLHIIYTDGTTSVISSNENWKTSKGAIRYSDIYNGEIIDNRYQKKDWLLEDYSDKDWQRAIVRNFNTTILTATNCEAVTKHEKFTPVNIFTSTKGEQIIDFGQNLVGIETIKIRGKANDSIRVYHAEVLDKSGNFYTDNLRLAKQENIYVLNGNGEEIFEPSFTFHGFRYIKIIGYPGVLRPSDIVVHAIYADMKKTGSFSCSNSLLNQLQRNIQWSQKGNFLDVPTDCPQRNERLGWTGDAQVFFNTSAFNMDVYNFFTRWLKDVKAAQFENGAIPHVVPDIFGGDAGGSAGWADAATIIPWNMYLLQGNKRVLQDQYTSMKQWVDYMASQSINDLWNRGFHFGDWLFYRPDDDTDGRAALTDKYLIAQCFFGYSTQLLINAAIQLGNTNDANKYEILLEKIKTAFNKEYVTPNGRLVSSSQTAYVLALQFDMLPDSIRSAAAKRLVQNIKDYNFHLTTGFLGTPYLCHVLTRFGYTDMAFTLLMQTTYPSWLYPVKMGATTIWERWDGQKPDSSFQTASMNSFNHYAYGAIGDWMYRTLGGIQPDGCCPGYKKTIIKPVLDCNVIKESKIENKEPLRFVDASLITGYGEVACKWQLTVNKILMYIKVPPNTSADVYIPASTADTIFESSKLLLNNSEFNCRRVNTNTVIVTVGSGEYHFVVNKAVK